MASKQKRPLEIKSQMEPVKIEVIGYQCPTCNAHAWVPEPYDEDVRCPACGSCWILTFEKGLD